jgi:predicted nucleic acid-binding protein
MTPLVLDASVAVKWFLPDAPDEADAPAACELLVGVQKGRLTLRQPAHWRPEIAAVLARRLPPEQASDAVADLAAIVGITIDDNASVMRLAIELSAALDHHLFDTLYHAVALDAGIPLVTADTRYHRKAAHLGRIVLLSEL